MNIINLTPHVINIVCDESDEKTLTIEPSGIIARCVEQREDLGVLSGVPVSRATYGAVENLPEPQSDTIYVVSALVLMAVGASRSDVFAPGPAVRDAAGQVIGCKGLSAGPAYQPRNGVFERHEWRSTNGRWGLEIDVRGAVRLNVSGDFIAAYRGKAIRLAEDSVVVEHGTDFVLVGGDLVLYEGMGTQIARVNLQSNREVTVLVVSDGDIVVSYGYKRRSSAWYRVSGFALLPLTASEKAEAKARRRKAAIEMTFAGKDTVRLTNYPARIAGKRFWANEYNGSEPREAESIEQLIAWAEEIAPLAEWKIWGV